MPNENATIEQRLSRLSVEKLSAQERSALWSSIATTHAHTPRAVPSPFFGGWLFTRTSITHSYSMITAAVALMIALSAGATVAVADNSRPGDALFAIDRAAENVRIAFAGDDKKDELRVRFASERADEFEEILEEESENIRLARADRESSRSAPAAEVSLMMATESDVSAKVADDASAGSDSNDDSDDDSGKSEARIANGLSVAVSYLTEVSNELSAKGNVEAKAAVDAVIARLNAKIADSEIRDFNIRFEDSGEGIRAEIRTDGEASGGGGIEVRGDGVKTKIEFEDGRVKIETEVEDSDDDGRGVDNPRDFPDDSSDDSSDDSNDDSSDDSSIDSPAPTSAGVEIEADTFLDLTVVKVEQNDQKQSFSTSARTRAAIVSAIASELGIAEADVDAALSLEIENRLSRPDDLIWGGNSGGSGGGDDDED